MTDREALVALATPEPEIQWRRIGQWRASTVSIRAWDRWNQRRIEALRHAKGMAA